MEPTASRTGVDLAEQPQPFGRQGLARASLACGVLSAVAFFGLAWALELGDAWWLVGGLLGFGAMALGLTALRRAAADRRSAIVGALLGAAVVGWFIAYLVVEAIA